MDKSSANGGPPTYAAASGSASGSSSSAVVSADRTTTPTSPTRRATALPFVTSGTASLSLQNNDSNGDEARPTALPRGVTLKEASNPASYYSITKVALELPLITETRRIPGPPPQSAPLPAFLLHCTLFASYDAAGPHPVPFRQAGCPATHSRGHGSATSRNKVSQSVSKLRKRLGVQIPLAYLGSPGFNPYQTVSTSTEVSTFAYLPHAQPRNGAEMAARSGNISRYRRVSLFQAQAKELTGIVSRPLVERVVSGIYSGQGIYNRMAVFPAEAVLRYSNKSVEAEQDAGDDGEQKTGLLSKLKAKVKSGGRDKSSDQRRSSVSGSHPIEQVKSADSVRQDTSRDISSEANGAGLAEVGSVKAAMVFATLDLLAPPPRLMETGGPYPKEMNKASDADLATSSRTLAEFDRGTDNERFERFLFAPTAADEQFCADMLRALERRGAIWVEAGRLITPSSRNPNPRERARFLVKGVFPERFTYRCKYYRARKFEPMPSDLDPKEIKRFGSPLIVHTVVERTGNEGVNMSDHLPSNHGETGPAAPATPGVDENGDEEARLDWEWDDQDNLAFDSSSAHGGEREEAAAPPDYKSTQKELLSGYGIESQRAKALIEAEQDFFTGWSIGVTEEPFKNGNWMESLGTGSSLWYAGSGM